MANIQHIADRIFKHADAGHLPVGYALTMGALIDAYDDDPDFHAWVDSVPGSAGPLFRGRVRDDRRAVGRLGPCDRHRTVGGVFGDRATADRLVDWKKSDGGNRMTCQPSAIGRFAAGKRILTERITFSAMTGVSFP